MNMKFLPGLAIVALILAACNNTGKLGASKMENRLDSISYALGHDLGKNLSEQGVDLNPEMVFRGMESTMSEGGEAVLTADEQRMLLTRLQTEIREKQMAQQQQQQQRQQQAAAVQVGMAAPEIALPTPEGEMLNLSDLRGKVVLVDFWASWCRPCRAENPNVVRVYNKYKDQGFEILGVSLDRDRAAWLQAIEKDGLTWPHISDLKFWQSQAAQTYGVTAIPYTVLVDRDGTIIAERLRGGSLEAKLAEIFGS